MRENRTSGSVQGAPGNRRSYCASEVRPATMEEVRERRASGDTTRARQAPF